MGPLNSEETQGETNVTKRHGRLKIRVTGTGNEHHNCQSDREMHPELPKTTQGKTAETSQEQQRGRGRIERPAILCKDAESNGPQTRPEVLWLEGNKLRHTHTQSSVRALFPSTAAYLQDILFFQFCCSQPKETCALCPHLW